jgi:hypothetical protein
MKRVAFLGLLLIVSPLFAATVGTMPFAGNIIYNSPSGDITPITFLSYSHPATASGAYTTVTLRWLVNSPSCASAFKIKFFRPVAGTAFLVTAERGPFNAVSGQNVVTLNPPVDVQEGDVIGITQLKTLASCGSVAFGAVSGVGARYTIVNSDPAPGSTVIEGNLRYSYIPSIRASTSADVLEGHVIVVGSSRGGFGSNFKTAMQITNPYTAPITGKLVFHPAGVSASAADPFLPISLPSLSTVDYDDVVATLGRNGLGSMDIITTNSHPPIVTTRIYNDNGTSGTAGTAEDVQTQSETALKDFAIGQLTTPADLTNYRLNIGIRTFDAGVTLLIQERDKNGGSVTVIERSYPPNYFDQVTATQFLDGAQLLPNASITVFVTAGSAVLYGATTDNRTNDPSLKIFTRL